MEKLNSKLITVDEKEASKITGLAVATLQTRRCRKMQPPYLKVGGRRVRYRLSDLEAFLDNSVIKVG